MNTFEYLMRHIPEIEEKIGYAFLDRSLLTTAFVHRSYVNENKDVEENNERLEFLGDSVLGLLMADYLFTNLPSTPEGDLSYLRSRLVEASSCMEYICKLNVEEYILLGKGERLNSGRGRESILADLFEAIIGAIYTDGGFEATREFIFRHFTDNIKEILKTPIQNWKAMLQDYCQRTFQQTPQYKVLSETGPDHSKTFSISVEVNNNELGLGIGPSKKEAQQAAALDAIKKINPQSQ